MFFLASRLAGWLLTPHNFLGLAVCAAALLLLSPWRRLGVAVTLFSALFVILVAATPLPEWSLRLLENRFPQARPLPERIDGIIVLGGAIGPHLSASRGQVALKASAERMTEGAGLAHRYPGARLIFTGGDASLTRVGLTEAEFARTVFRQAGLPPDRVETEAASRNTYENALYVAQMLTEAGEAPEGAWVLVTSAYHMPRSVGCFRRVGLPVIPFPVDYRSDGMLSWWPPGFAVAGGLDLLALAIHEWVGLLAYWLNDYVETPFPGPRGGEPGRLTTARESRTGKP